MKPAPFRYFDPRTVDEALALLHEWGDESKVLAGGQTLSPMLNFRVLRPGALIDINRIAGLANCQDSKVGMTIGAMTRQQVLEDDGDLMTRQPLVAAAIPYIAHRAIRNRGTVGGSLAHADPAAEWGALTMTLDAEMIVRKHGAPHRTVRAADFFRGLLETAIEPDELLAEIRIPSWPKAAGWSIVEFSRRHGDFALAGIACMISLTADGKCSEARITTFGVEGRPKRLTFVEDELRGNKPGTALMQKLAHQAATDASPLEDNHASAAYRRHLVGVLLVRSIMEAVGRCATS